MIECPKCGFSQPQDKYCASCGVDMEALLARPKPFLVRVLQNPNLHLLMIGILIALVIGWMFYTQRSVVQREVGHLLDLPLSSREAGEADEAPENELAKPITKVQAQSHAAIKPQPQAPPVKKPLIASEEQPTTNNTVSKPQRLMVTFWEIQREALTTLVSGAESASDGSAGRAVVIAQGQKAMETIQRQAVRIGQPKMAMIKNGAQIDVISPANEAFRFGMTIRTTEETSVGKGPALRWDLEMILPISGEVGSDSFRTTESNLNGLTDPPKDGVVIIIFDPPIRMVREEIMTHTGDGPWTIFSSNEFRSGLSDWIATVQLK